MQRQPRPVHERPGKVAAAAVFEQYCLHVECRIDILLSFFQEHWSFLREAASNICSTSCTVAGSTAAFCTLRNVRVLQPFHLNCRQPAQAAQSADC
jgi:hypothetical protein